MAEARWYPSALFPSPVLKVQGFRVFFFSSSSAAASSCSLGMTETMIPFFFKSVACCTRNIYILASSISSPPQYTWREYVYIPVLMYIGIIYNDGKRIARDCEEFFASRGRKTASLFLLSRGIINRYAEIVINVPYIYIYIREPIYSALFEFAIRNYAAVCSLSYNNFRCIYIHTHARAISRAIIKFLTPACA